MSELRPCAHCGSAFISDGNNRVACRNCGMQTRIHMVDPHGLWNTRAPDWQDISTAPRDGTKVLGWGMLHAPSWATVEEPTIQITRWDEETSSWYAPTMGSWVPTKWMPLPAPPKEVG